MGDFGSGKTTFLRHLHAELTREWLEGHEQRMAVFVPLRHYDHATNTTALAHEICRRELNADVSFRTFEKFVKSGRFVFLFDGFDEMSRASDQNLRHSLYAKLMHVSAGSKTIVSCRPGYFVSPAESQELFGNLKRSHGPGAPQVFDWHTRPRRHQNAAHDLASDPDPSGKLEAMIEGASSAARSALAIEISLMTDDQIMAFLRNHESEIKSVGETDAWNAQTLATVIRTVYDLKDLAKRPILLRLAIETVPRFLPQEDGTYEFRSGDKTLLFGTITPTILYFAYTERELTREHEKSSSPLSVSKQIRRQFLVHLARMMAEHGRTSLTNTELTKEVKAFFRPARDQIDQCATDIRACSFLAPSGRGDQFRFVHKSFLEYFAAESFVPALDRIDALEQRLVNDTLSHEIMYFLGSYIVEFCPNAIEKLQELARESNNWAVRRNALNVLACARAPESHLQEANISSLYLFDLEMEKLVVERSKVSTLLLHRSCIDLFAAKGSAIEILELRNCSPQSARIDAANATTRVLLTECAISRLHIVSSDICIHGSDSIITNLTLEHARVDRLRFQRCRVHLDATDRERECPVEAVDSVVSAGGHSRDLGATHAPVLAIKSALLGLRIRYAKGAFASCVFIGCELDDPKMIKNMHGNYGYFCSDTDMSSSAENCPALFFRQHLDSLREQTFSEPVDLAKLVGRLAKLDANQRIAIRFYRDHVDFSTLTSEDVMRRVDEARGDVVSLARILLGDTAVRSHHR